MKHTLLAVAIAPTLVLAASAPPDASFYKSLAEGGMAEVQLGQLAETKAADAGVKDFAAMMVKDHTAANEHLKALASSKNVDLPGGPGVAARAKKTELEVLSGHAFDSSYVAGQIKAHRETVALLRKEIASGEDADAKAFAQKVLPTVEGHLKAVDKIADGLGIARQ